MQQNPTYNIPATPVVPETPLGQTTPVTPEPKIKTIYVVVIAGLVVIVLALMSLAVFLVMRDLELSDNNNQPFANTTVEPTEEQSDTTPNIITSAQDDESEYKDFSYPVFISIVRDKNDPYTVSGQALRDAVLLPSEDEDEASFVIKGDGYELGISAFYESEASAYSDFVLIDTVGEEKIARVKDNYNLMQENQYKYVRSTTVSDTDDCEGMEMELLPAPCGSSHYTSGNEVETFYIFNVSCVADTQDLSKCDDIVKSLSIKY